MTLQPTINNERIVSIDIIRGMALFGILFVNIPDFDRLHMGATYYGADTFFRLGYDLFIQQKFYLIFSFLFGLGSHMFISRAENYQHPHIYLLFTRRLLALLCFGIIHQMIWKGDILTKYALYGFILLPFYKMKPKNIIIITFLLFMINFSVLIGNFKALNSHMTIFYMPIIIMFLLGFYVSKKQIITNASQNLYLFKMTQFISLIISLPTLAYIIWSFEKETGPFHSISTDVVVFSGIPLSIFYISTFILLLENKKAKNALRPLGYVGQIALTNYLFQTACGIILTRLIGMNLNISLTRDFLLAILIFTIQILLSVFLVKRYQRGPMEYIWSLLTYGYIKRYGINEQKSTHLK